MGRGPPTLTPAMDTRASVRETAIFGVARSLPAEARAFYLDGACAGDALLRQEVEELLKADQSAGAFLPEPAAGAGGPLPAGARPDPGATLGVTPGTSEKPGDTIDRYRLMEEIGEGGFGVVYVAEQKEPVKRRVALKIIKLGMDTKAVVARFEAERQALAMMDHSNIAKVLDAGTTQTGRPYFVMELVRGIRITDYCDQANLSTKERLELFIQVCQAIQHAHQKGIIHRDIKPSNILVTLHDGVPVPKVIDFGIAKATEGRLTEHTIYTQLHQFIGTPAYMSPEQAEMSGLDIDTRSDIYSLGVLLYELLVGQTPFDAKELMSRGVDAMRKIIREEEPARPSTRVATLGAGELTTTARRRGVETSRLLQQLKGDLDWIVMKCLEKDRSRRYETANGLAVDLKRHLGNEPVSARPPSAGYRFQKAFRRNKVAFGAAAAVAGALILGVTVSTWELVAARKAQRETEVAREGEQQHRMQAQSALEVAEAQKQRADAQARKATASQQRSEQSLYAAKMNLAQQAWERNNVGRVKELLEETATHSQRGFEWYYWQRQIHRELITLKGHGAAVLAVAYSPDGQRIVSGSWDDSAKVSGKAKVWDAATGKELLTFGGDGGQMWSVAFSPDGQRIATGGQDGTAKVWDAATGKELLSLEGHRAAAWSVAFSPDGQKIVTGGDETAKVWEAATGKELLTVRNGTGVASVVVTRDGQRIVIGGWNGTAKVWDAATGKGLLTLTGHVATVRSVAVSPDGQRIATGSYDHTAKVWDAVTGQDLLTLKGHSGGITSIAFSPDGRRIATGSHDTNLKVWDAVSGQDLFTLKGHIDGIGVGRAVAFSPDGGRIASGSWDQTIKVWDLNKGEATTLAGHTDLINSVTFSPDSQRVATGSYDQTVKVLDVLSGKELLSLTGHVAQIRSVAFAPDGQRIATGGGDGRAKVWELASGRQLAALEGHGDLINSVAFSPDGQRIVTSSHDQTAKVWEAATGRELLNFTEHSNRVTCAAFSPDGRWIATGSSDGAVKVWVAATAKQRLPLKGHSDCVTSVAFSPDGQRIVTGSDDKMAKVWDAVSGNELFSLKGHIDWVTSVVFSPDGQRIVTGSHDRTAKVWDADSGEELASLNGHSGRVMSVAFSPDGHRIVSGSWDRTARIWEAATASQSAEWRRKELSDDERVRRELATTAEKECNLQEQDPGAIKQWLMLFPVPNGVPTWGEALQREQIPQEANLRPRAGERVKAGQNERTWRAVQLKNNLIYFSELLSEPISGCVAYSVCYVLSETDQAGIQLKVGADTRCKVYLNGRELYRDDHDGPYVPDQHVVTGVQLGAGVNVLVFKVVAGAGWLGSVRLTDAAGQPVRGIRVTLTPP